MKKYLLLIITLLLLPISVNAKGLLTKLNVGGIGDLTLNKKTWNLSFSTTLDYIDIKAEGVEGSEVTGDGRQKIKNGMNTFEIVVTNGDEKETYKLNIDVEKDGEDTTTTDDITDKKEEKNDTKKEDKKDTKEEDKKDTKNDSKKENDTKKVENNKENNSILPIILLILSAIVILCIIVLVVIRI